MSQKLGSAAALETPSFIERYVSLTKPGIVVGNAISTAGGFFLASKGHPDPALFLVTLCGVSLIVASGCVFNNVIDRDIDEKMERTRNRALVIGLVSPAKAIVFAALLGMTGGTLLHSVSPLAARLSEFGFVVYVGLYSLYLKRHSAHATLIGSLSGAMPPAIGYCAVTGRFDGCAVLLLLIFGLWQMPHFYAIAILRLSDYAAAGIPVLPVQRGIAATKRYIVFYTGAFMVSALALSAGGYTGVLYTGVAAGLTAYWLAMAISGYRANDDRVWARRMFLCSIVVVTILSVMMSLDAKAPALT